MGGEVLLRLTPRGLCTQRGVLGLVQRTGRPDHWEGEDESVSECVCVYERENERERQREK